MFVFTLTRIILDWFSDRSIIYFLDFSKLFVSQFMLTSLNPKIGDLIDIRKHFEETLNAYLGRFSNVIVNILSGMKACLFMSCYVLK